MRPSNMLAAVFVMLLLWAGGSAMARSAPPPTAQHDVVSHFHGVTVHDPYRWLEDNQAPSVQRWIKAQNAQADAVLDAVRMHRTLSRRVSALARVSSTRSSPKLVGNTLFYLRQTPPQQQPVLVAQPWPDGKARVLIDPNKGEQHTAITGFWPSPHGRYVAYGTAEGGSELTTIHVFDLDHGKKLEDALPFAGGGTTPQGVAWDADAGGFTYVRFPPPKLGGQVTQFNAALMHHTLGGLPAVDPVIFGEHYSPVAEYRLLSSAGAKHLAVLANIGDGGPADVYLRRGRHWVRVLDHSANVRGATWVGQRLLVESFAGAPRGKVLAVSLSGNVTTLVQQTKGALQRIDPVAGGFVLTRSRGAHWWMQQYTGGGRFVRRVPLPARGIAVDAVASRSGDTHALIAYSGWSQPLRWADYDGDAGTLKTTFKVKPAADYSGIQVHDIQATSADGTRIPVTLLSMRGVKADGKRPAIVYGYGGFDIPVKPHFIGPWLAWLEHGGVYAFANIRGGNEFGEAWHRQGMTTHKQNVFDDFHAAAMALVKHKWTDRRHLGIMGASNGGLLMGAELTQHPDDYRAVVSMVGIYDMIRHQTAFPNGRYNIPEYGSVKNPAQFKALYAYSPLYHVKAETAYPAVLMTTGVNDSRVAPWQSRKFTAALQNASTSKRPILLLTRMHAGHGIDAPFSQRVGNTALAMTFFARELDLSRRKVVRKK